VRDEDGRGAWGEWGKGRQQLAGAEPLGAANWTGIKSPAAVRSSCKCKGGKDKKGTSCITHLQR
jgi:hypothetical protein